MSYFIIMHKIGKDILSFYFCAFWPRQIKVQVMRYWIPTGGTSVTSRVTWVTEDCKWEIHVILIFQEGRKILQAAERGAESQFQRVSQPGEAVRHPGASGWSQRARPKDKWQLSNFNSFFLEHATLASTLQSCMSSLKDIWGPHCTLSDKWRDVG